ncbi:DNA mismatch repair endonuclease MutL [Pseudoalteromonas denitrificans]|uniref:DNA mismatch repair protein MutL n=1 Tax=Pseudoalteromonas denitrificans DSM 6059 TaxID=1123010 RepID=A0A1I1JYC2_9GAMM|nr:DNA mismatch repair endonuclease MutL [Pseudoalteromonas denitrificans]SFC53689.1 DNA mismatch repair protein MutL [Pseudoalteromonas denitrificans DSM 6059]
MSIEILPARLANQIAAGEVVERPASVVKELVENSLDAGATRIQIDIERGGHKLIRIRDNGSGISKDELALALSRHATSKLKTLDDLECINSLGFRGEALASISSVSRLTLSSKPQLQSEAWQAYAEGRDMEVKIKPTAHPDGTTIEVVDLFFNTPARRKFLRTEKTEFNHIDELIKRIALSRFDVGITLKHNGKVVRQYRAQSTTEQGIKRVAQVAGRSFLEHALYLESGDEQLKMFGWALPVGMNKDPQYTYVNGRMMRDKLILHAIRQAFEEMQPDHEVPAFVFYLEIDPLQVDVNVHPAKHEVRFHQARLIHDFILQAVKKLAKQTALFPESTPVQVSEDEVPFSLSDYLPTHIPEKTNYSSSVSSSGGNSCSSTRSPVSYQQQHQVNSFYQGIGEQAAKHFDHVAELPNELETVSSEKVEIKHREIISLTSGKCIFKQNEDIYLGHFNSILPAYWLVEIELEAELPGKALLLPVRVNISESDALLIESNLSWLNILGYDIKLSTHFLMIKKLPVCIYSEDVNVIVNRIIEVCKTQCCDINNWLSWQASGVAHTFFTPEIHKTLINFIQRKPELMNLIYEKAVRIDLSDYLSQLQRNITN